MRPNHDEAPVLDALSRYHEGDELGFSPPGHKQARGADPRARAVLGDAVYLGDVLANGGLDDRLSRGRVLERAEELRRTLCTRSTPSSPRAAAPCP